MTKFKKCEHQVDLGDSYLTRSSMKEIIICQSKSVINDRVVTLLNNKIIHNYGIINYGSSSSKTMEGHELFLIKSAETGVASYSVLNLEEVDDAYTKGLNKSLKSYFNRVNIT